MGWLFSNSEDDGICRDVDYRRCPATSVPSQCMGCLAFGPFVSTIRCKPAYVVSRAKCCGQHAIRRTINETPIVIVTIHTGLIPAVIVVNRVIGSVGRCGAGRRRRDADAREFNRGAFGIDFDHGHFPLGSDCPTIPSYGEKQAQAQARLRRSGACSCRQSDCN